jgi:cell wall-associated NlpC family hydrolase
VSTATAAAAFALVAVLPGTPSAGTPRPITAAAADLSPAATLGQRAFGPTTAAPPIPSLDEVPDATSAAPPGSTPYSSAVNLTGGAAAPAAVRAVQFALTQVGKPYVWGAEGPDTYDCSGLVQAAYAAAGVSMPRVARAQYRATTPVLGAAMVPGDLLFFGPDPTDVESIHHVGIYLGDGLMVHAPTAGDVVRVAPVWWAEFFGAARVVGAVSGPGSALPFTIPPPTPVFRTVSGPSPSRQPARRPSSDAPVSRNPSLGDSGGPPGAGNSPAGCPADDSGSDPRAAGTTVSVAATLGGLLGAVLRPRPGDAAAPPPGCSASRERAPVRER